MKYNSLIYDVMIRFVLAILPLQVFFEERQKNTFHKNSVFVVSLLIKGMLW
jgi:hypothetical protein